MGMLRVIGYLLLVVMVVGCGTVRETTITDKTVKIAPEWILDTLDAELTPNPSLGKKGEVDTVYFSGNTVIKHDTVLSVKYYPKLQKFTVFAKPDTVTYTYRDTVKVTTVKEYTWWDKFKSGLVGAVVVAVFGFALYILNKFKSFTSP